MCLCDKYLVGIIKFCWKLVLLCFSQGFGRIVGEVKQMSFFYTFVHTAFVYDNAHNHNALLNFVSFQVKKNHIHTPRRLKASHDCKVRSAWESVPCTMIAFFPPTHNFSVVYFHAFLPVHWVTRLVFMEACAFLCYMPCAKYPQNNVLWKTTFPRNF